MEAYNLKKEKLAKSPLKAVKPLGLAGKSGKNFLTRDGFQNLASKLGLGSDSQFASGRYEYGPFLTRNRQELEAAYRDSWIVGAVVDTIAEDMTRARADIDSELTPQEITKINNFFEEKDLWHAVCQCIKWARLFGGSLGIIMIKGQNLRTPLRVETVGPGSFGGILAMDRWIVDPPLSDLVTEPGPHFGMPSMYRVMAPDSGLKPGQEIHHTRVIRMDGIELPYYQKRFENMWGESVVERLYDRLIAFDSVSFGAAQLVFKAHLRGIGVSGLRDALTEGGEAEEAIIKMFEYIRSMQSNEGLTLLDAEDTFWTQSYTFSGLADMILQNAQQISGSTGIPLVRLLGQSPAGLNSTGESDLRNYYDLINKLQETQLRRHLRTIYRIVSFSELGKDLPEDFSFSFRSLWQIPDKEKIEIAKSVSDAMVQLINSSVFSRKMVLQELKQVSKITGYFSNITQEHIDSASDEVAEPVEGLGGQSGEGGVTNLLGGGEPDSGRPKWDKKATGKMSPEEYFNRYGKSSPVGDSAFKSSFISRIWDKVKHA